MNCAESDMPNLTTPYLVIPILIVWLRSKCSKFLWHCVWHSYAWAHCSNLRLEYLLSGPWVKLLSLEYLLPKGGEVIPLFQVGKLYDNLNPNNPESNQTMTKEWCGFWVMISFFTQKFSTSTKNDTDVGKIHSNTR